VKSIILIAGIGKRIRSVTEGPKCLLKISGVTLLERYLSALESMSVLDVVMVVGYQKERIIKFTEDLRFQGNIKFIENPDFTQGSILSLYRAKDELDGDSLLMDGDVYFESKVLKRLMEPDLGNLVAVDTTSSSSGEEMMVGIREGKIFDMKRNLVGSYDTVGEAVGFYRFNGQACIELRGILEEQVRLGKCEQGHEDILPILFQRAHFSPVIVDGLRWVEIDFEDDVHRAENLAKG